MIDAKTAQDFTQATLYEDLLKYDDYLNIAIKAVERKVLLAIYEGKFETSIHHKDLFTTVRTKNTKNLLDKELRKYLIKQQYSVTDHGESITIVWG